MNAEAKLILGTRSIDTLANLGTWSGERLETLHAVPFRAVNTNLIFRISIYLSLDDSFKVSPPQPNLRLLVQTSTLKLPSMDPLVQCSIADPSPIRH